MPITTNVTNEQISVSVGETQIDVSVSGGVGPAGPPGVTAIADATDVRISGAVDGDVLRYSGGKWRNYPDANLVDGGNW